MNTRRRIFIILGAVIILGGGIFLAWYFGFIGSGDRYLYRAIQNRPDLVAIFNDTKIQEAKIKASPEKAGIYLTLALDWKSLGDLSGTGAFYKKSLAVYEDVIKKFGTKNILFYLNAGKVAELVPDFGKAETYYKKAIEISPGDDSGYTDLAELYDYKLHKTKEEVVAVYTQGAKKLVNPIVMIGQRGSYLRRIGDYSGALPDYEILATNFPDNQGYKDIVADLKSKIARPQ
jgi:tetratricopeptide (TPR) repeat protein